MIDHAYCILCAAVAGALWERANQRGREGEQLKAVVLRACSFISGVSALVFLGISLSPLFRS
jgi:hypothetical protein